MTFPAHRRGNPMGVTAHQPAASPGSPRHLDVSLRPTLKAPVHARHALRRLGLPAAIADDAELLVTEFVTNSVRHSDLCASDRIHVRVDWSGDRLRVRVRDRIPMPSLPVWAAIRPAPDAQAGWGLYLVE